MMNYLRAMTGAIIVYDHTALHGAFSSKSEVKVRFKPLVVIECMRKSNFLMAKLCSDQAVREGTRAVETQRPRSNIGIAQHHQVLQSALQRLLNSRQDPGTNGQVVKTTQIVSLLRTFQLLKIMCSHLSSTILSNRIGV